MSTSNIDAGAAVAVAGIFFAIFASLGLLAIQVYDFLAYGSWHAPTVSDLMLRAGQSADTILDPNAHWDWAGVGKVMNWLVYSTPAFTVTMIFGCLIMGLGLLIMSDQG